MRTKSMSSDSDKSFALFQLQNLFTSLWSMVIRKAVILQFKCIKFSNGTISKTPFHLLLALIQAKIDKTFFIPLALAPIFGQNAKYGMQFIPPQKYDKKILSNT